MALLLAQHHSAHGFLPLSRSIQRFILHLHAITPVVSLWGRQHEFQLPLKQARIQARRLLGEPMLSARPNLALKSDPTCIAFRSLSTFRYLGSAHRLGAGVAA